MRRRGGDGAGSSAQRGVPGVEITQGELHRGEIQAGSYLQSVYTRYTGVVLVVVVVATGWILPPVPLALFGIELVFVDKNMFKITQLFQIITYTIYRIIYIRAS